MPIRLDQRSGSFEIEYTFAPPGGLHVQAPETLIPDTASPAMSGVMLRNSELRSMPAFVLKFPSPDLINPILGQYSFLDVNNVAHTVLWTSRGLWQLAQNNPPPSQPWNILGGPALNSVNPIAYRTFVNVLYYTNGAPFVASWDGITQQPTSTTTFGDASVAASVAGISKANSPTILSGSTGPLALGALYIAELDNHILLANVTVLDQLGVNAATSGSITPAGVIYNFPQRLWWSANGLPNQWDFVANTNAGENDFLDVPDIITGIVTIGIAGYIFRSNGITQFVPTGNGIAPFQFDHLWASDHGVGNVLPWSISSYGAFACFVSTEQIYQIGVNSFSDIGGTARDAIMSDLSIASGTPVGSIVPKESLGFVYLTYRISIPLTSFTRHYIYSFEGKYWEVRDTAGLLISGREEEIWTGQLSSFGIPGIIPPSTGVAGGTQSGSGSSGGGGGGSQGGGGFGCFTGNVCVLTPKGFVRFDRLGDECQIINSQGTFTAKLIIHHNYTDDMLDMGEGKLVTKGHGIYDGGSWIVAEQIWPDLSRINGWHGTVYNLHVITENEQDRHFILENGALAHNNRPLKE